MTILRLSDPENICALLLCNPVKRRVTFEHPGGYSSLAVASCRAQSTDGGFGPSVAVAFVCGELSYPGKVLAVKITRQTDTEAEKEALENEALEALKVELTKTEP